MALVHMVAELIDCFVEAGKKATGLTKTV